MPESYAALQSNILSYGQALECFLVPHHTTGAVPQGLLPGCHPVDPSHVHRVAPQIWVPRNQRSPKLSGNTTESHHGSITHERSGQTVHHKSVHHAIRRACLLIRRACEILTFCEQRVPVVLAAVVTGLQVSSMSPEIVLSESGSGQNLEALVEPQAV